MVALEESESSPKVRARSLRTQQRAKSQCTKAQNPVSGAVRIAYELTSLTAATIAFVLTARPSRRHSHVQIKNKKKKKPKRWKHGNEKRNKI